MEADRKKFEDERLERLKKEEEERQKVMKEV
jgi:hypothetical protein